MLDNAGLKNCLKKMVTPAVKREAVARLEQNHEISERRAYSGDGLPTDDGALSLAGRLDDPGVARTTASPPRRESRRSATAGN